MTPADVLAEHAFRITLPDGEAHRVVAADEPSAKRLLRSKLEITRLPAGCKVEPWEGTGPVIADEGAPPLRLDLSSARSTPAASKPARGSKAAWKSLPDAEKAAYLLDHQTLPDRSWTDEPRLPKESRSDFIRRVLLGVTAEASA